MAICNASVANQKPMSRKNVYETLPTLNMAVFASPAQGEVDTECGWGIEKNRVISTSKTRQVGNVVLK